MSGGNIHILPELRNPIWYDYGLLARYLKLRVAHAPGMPGTFSPPPRVSDPDMHHGTCVRHVPWCMPGSLTRGFLWSHWRGKRSRHSRRMRNPQTCVYGKRSMGVVSHLIDMRRRWRWLKWGCKYRNILDVYRNFQIAICSILCCMLGTFLSYNTYKKWSVFLKKRTNKQMYEDVRTHARWDTDILIKSFVSHAGDGFVCLEINTLDLVAAFV